MGFAGWLGEQIFHLYPMCILLNQLVMIKIGILFWINT